MESYNTRFLLADGENASVQRSDQLCRRLPRGRWVPSVEACPCLSSRHAASRSHSLQPAAWQCWAPPGCAHTKRSPEQCCGACAAHHHPVAQPRGSTCGPAHPARRICSRLRWLLGRPYAEAAASEGGRAGAWRTAPGTPLPTLRRRGWSRRYAHASAEVMTPLRSALLFMARKSGPPSPTDRSACWTHCWQTADPRLLTTSAWCTLCIATGTLDLRTFPRAFLGVRAARGRAEALAWLWGVEQARPHLREAGCEPHRPSP
jgi:hypothetical protein